MTRSLEYELEKNLRNAIILQAGQDGITLFNNPVGTAWAGKYNSAQQCVMYPRAVRYGLAVGSSDTIGITPIEITPDMVGKKIGVFTAVEVKLNKNGSYGETKEQKNFGKFVQRNGGIYVCADKYSDITNYLAEKNLKVAK